MKLDFIYFQCRALLIQNYKYDRLYGRGNEYGDAVVNSFFNDLINKKEASIGSYESKSGAHLRFFLDGELVVQD